MVSGGGTSFYTVTATTYFMCEPVNGLFLGWVPLAELQWSYCLQASWAPGTKKPSFTSCVILGQLGQQPMTYSCPFQPASLTLTVGGVTYSNVDLPQWSTVVPKPVPSWNPLTGWPS